MKDWTIEDIYDKFDIGQYGGRKGTGTEHMIVCLLDRILKLLDSHPDSLISTLISHQSLEPAWTGPWLLTDKILPLPYRNS